MQDKKKMAILSFSQYPFLWISVNSERLTNTDGGFRNCSEIITWGKGGYGHGQSFRKMVYSIYLIDNKYNFFYNAYCALYIWIEIVLFGWGYLDMVKLLGGGADLAKY